LSGEGDENTGEADGDRREMFGAEGEQAGRGWLESEEERGIRGKL
jgi:hypothetical protein